MGNVYNGMQATRLELRLSPPEKITGYIPIGTIHTVNLRSSLHHVT